jgi:hypothetical protein
VLEPTVLAIQKVTSYGSLAVNNSSHEAAQQNTMVPVVSED